MLTSSTDQLPADSQQGVGQRPEQQASGQQNEDPDTRQEGAVHQEDAASDAVSAQSDLASEAAGAATSRQASGAAAPQTAASEAAAKAAAATALEVAAAKQDVVQGTARQHEAAEPDATLQGMVVWGSFKGWPAWPGLVTTDEEMDVAEVKSKKGQLLKGMPSWLQSTPVQGRIAGSVQVQAISCPRLLWPSCIAGCDILSFNARLLACKC